jgi:uncharacterized protein (TIGR03437 family)
LNRERRVIEEIHAECPEDFIHSAPFGNWGVTSNFGGKVDGHQFDGWCHDVRICDNAGNCRNACMDGWYEWNSCTDNSLFRAPNCTLYNSAQCTEQTSPTGINIHGMKQVDVPVSCPSASGGGCGDVKQFASGTNFLSLYELDPVCCDALVQSVYFPEVTVPLTCDALGCAPAQSGWVKPSFWDSPATPGKVFADLAVAVNWGAFVDPNRACRLETISFTTVTAAGYIGPNAAPDAILSAFGEQLAPVTAQATSLPLPESLGGISLRVIDSAGMARTSPLLYVSPRQVNFILPGGLARGQARLTILSGDSERASGLAQIEPVAPGVFTADSSASGIASAIAVRVAADGTSSTQAVYGCDGGTCTAVPIDLGEPLDRTYLVLFGTGIRNRSSVSAVAVVIGGENARVEYAGPQPEYPGLDQVNLLIPPDLKGRGVVEVSLTVDSRTANPVQVSIR